VRVGAAATKNSMAWIRNNSKNVRFNPNRRDDRLLLSEVTARRVHKPRKQTKAEEELISTDLGHVLGMPPDTRVDWLDMALMQLALGKLKPASLYDVIAIPKFANTSGKARKPLKAKVLANLHLFKGKQKRAIEELWKSEPTKDAEPNTANDGDDNRRKRSRSLSSRIHKRNYGRTCSTDSGRSSRRSRRHSSGSGSDSDSEGRLAKDRGGNGATRRSSCSEDSSESNAQAQGRHSRGQRYERSRSAQRGRSRRGGSEGRRS